MPVRRSIGLKQDPATRVQILAIDTCKAYTFQWKFITEPSGKIRSTCLIPLRWFHAATMEPSNWPGDCNWSALPGVCRITGSPMVSRACCACGSAIGRLMADSARYFVPRDDCSNCTMASAARSTAPGGPNLSRTSANPRRSSARALLESSSRCISRAAASGVKSF